jgi:hypothetical protein
MMSNFFDQIFSKIFPAEKNKVSHKENFKQLKVEEEEVEDWLNSEEGKSVLRMVHKNYHFKKSGINATPQIHLLNSPYANGFAISFEEPFTEKFFQYLFHGLGKLILNLGYYQVSLDRKIDEHLPGQIKVTEKLYLKPIVKQFDTTHQINQKYGNIAIEKVGDGQSSSYLKVLVTIYQDHLYQKALPFDQFIEDLFQNIPS